MRCSAAPIGFLIGDRVSVRQRLNELEERVRELLRRSARPAEPSRAPAAEERADQAARDAVVAAQRSEEPRITSAERPQAAAATPERAAPQSSAPPVAARRTAGEDIALVRWLRAYFTSGNLVVKIGAIILFIGVAFLLKYAAEHTRIPIEVRMIGVAAGAIALLLLGWRLRKRRQGYGLILQGIAVGILYLTVFAALRLYALVPAGAAFFLLAGIVVFSGLLAVLQNSLALAMMAAAGGFLAPILTSTGQGSHVMLFSYYAVLNAGLLGIAWFKSWRPLNLLGFLFTFGIGTAWGVLRYRSDQLASTEPFLILFFLLYVAIAVLFAFRQAPRFTYYVDGSLIFGTPVVAFGLQTGLVRDIPFALSFSAVALGAFYLLLATFLHRTRRETLRLLVEAFLALGVAFVTLAVPLALDGRWTAATWALEGAALLWVGLRQNRKLPRAAGILLQLGAGIAFFAHTPSATNAPPLVHSGVVGAVLIAVAAIVSSRMLDRNRERLAGYEQPAMAVLFWWGSLWWVFGWLNEIERIGSVVRPDLSTYVLQAWLLFVTATAWFSSWLERRLQWPIARIPALLLLPVLVLFTIGSAIEHDHPFAELGWLGWPVAFLAWYAILRRHESTLDHTLSIVLHALGALLVVFLLSVEATWMIARATQSLGVWSMLAWALIPAVTLLALPSLAGGGRWPVGRHLQAYLSVTRWHARRVPGGLVAVRESHQPRRSGAPALRAHSEPAGSRAIVRAGGARALPALASPLAARARHGAADAPFHPRHARRGAVRVAQCRAAAHAALLGRDPLRPGHDARIHHGAERAVDLLDGARARRHGLVGAQRATLRLVRGRRIDGCRGREAVHGRPVERRHGRAHRFVSRRGRPDAGDRIPVAGAARTAEGRSMKRLLTTAAAMLLALTAEADEFSREDFAYALPLQVDEGAPLHRVSVPLAVYRHTRRADLGDLRVLNAAGETVPYAVRSPPGDSTRERSPVALSHFPLHGDPVRATQAIELRVRAGDAEVELRTDGPNVLSVPVSAYLLDARLLEDPVKALALQWPAGTPDFSVSIQVEASDDLASWHTIVGTAPLANLEFAGQRLVRNRIEFAPTRAKFLRLSWPAGAPAPALETVSAQPADARVESERIALRVPGTASTEVAGEFAFDLGAHVPVERVQLELPQPNTIANVSLFLRAGDDRPWDLVAQGVAYRLVAAGGEVTNAPFAVGRRQARHWRLQVSPGGGGLGAGAPQLVAQWVPHDVVFAARGTAPFELVYGSASATAAAVPLSSFTSAQDDNRSLQLAVARAGEEVVAGGTARIDRKPFAWRTIVLWGVLILAVVVLAWMALRLSRQMAK